MQWGEARRFTSFSGSFMPNLSEAPSETAAPQWGTEHAAAVSPGFADEYWYGFSWDALVQGASSVYDASPGTLTVLPGA